MLGHRRRRLRRAAVGARARATPASTSSRTSRSSSTTSPTSASVAQLQVRLRLRSTSTTSAPVRRSSLYTFPTIAAYLAAKNGAEPVRLHDDVAAHRRPGVQHGDEPVQHVRAGRLADRADAEGALRRPLRPLQVSGRHRQRAAARRRTSFNIDQNNFGPRVGVAWSLDSQTVLARQHRHHVRPADPRRLRAGAAAVRVAAGAGLHVQRHAAGAPAFPSDASTTGTLQQQSPWAVDPDFQVAHTWQANAQLERAFGQRFHGVDRRHVREGSTSCPW